MKPMFNIYTNFLAVFANFAKKEDVHFYARKY